MAHLATNAIRMNCLLNDFGVRRSMTGEGPVLSERAKINGRQRS
jgi:hypothetical protein